MPLTQVSSRAIEDTLRYVLGADGSNHYTFTGKGLNGAVNDPTLTLSRGHTYVFENRNSSGAHPFYIKTSIANGGTNDAYNTGVTNNGGAGGTEIVFTVPHDAPDLLYYQCSSHSSMAGQLKIAGAVADGSITTAKLAADAVDGTKIADDAINSEHFVDGSIDTAHIADSQITNGKLAADAVTTAKIANSAITNSKLGDDCVTGSRIADDAVANEHIAANAVDTAQLATNSVTTLKLVDDAVTDAKINGMAASKLTGALPAISGANLTNLPAGGKVTRVFEVKSSGTSTYWYYSQGNPWITTGTISNVSATSRFLIFGRFELRQATQHNSVTSSAYFGSSGGSVYGGGSDSTNTTSWRSTEFTAYDYASNTSDRSYSINASSGGSNSSYGAQVRNAYILVLELDIS